MKTGLILISNVGRSGSSFLYRVLSKNCAQPVTVTHEVLPAAITRPRLHARAFDPESQRCVLSDPAIARQVDEWKQRAESELIIECGWTISHLAPIFASQLGDRFRFATLTRHPLAVTASRAVMGNYDGRYGNDDAHELSPFDSKATLKGWQDGWAEMTPFEKCFYWWAEWAAREKEMQSELGLRHLGHIKAADMFGESGVRGVLDLLSIPAKHDIEVDVDRNPLEPWLLEAYPLGESWRRCLTEPQYASAAQTFGYEMPSAIEAEKWMAKYQRPKNFTSWLRWRSGWWRLRGRASRLYYQSRRRSLAAF